MSRHDRSRLNAMLDVAVELERKDRPCEAYRLLYEALTEEEELLDEDRRLDVEQNYRAWPGCDQVSVTALPPFEL